jgi:hypothetical protein
MTSLPARGGEPTPDSIRGLVWEITLDSTGTVLVVF